MRPVEGRTSIASARDADLPALVTTSGERMRLRRSAQQGLQARPINNGNPAAGKLDQISVDHGPEHLVGAGSSDAEQLGEAQQGLQARPFPHSLRSKKLATWASSGPASKSATRSWVSLMRAANDSSQRLASLGRRFSKANRSLAGMAMQLNRAGPNDVHSLSQLLR
jgi:hypothetical protein